MGVVCVCTYVRVCVCVCIIEYQFSVCARTRAATATAASEGSQSFINVGGTRPVGLLFVDLAAKTGGAGVWRCVCVLFRQQGVGALGPSCAVANGSFGGSPCALSHLSCAHTRPGQTAR